ncbi:MAG: hypothetical protein ACKO6N_19225 [Myxococcota bacterium]
MSPLWKLLLCSTLALSALPTSADAQSRSRTAPAEDIEEEEDDVNLKDDSSDPKQALVEVARGLYVKSDPGFMDFAGVIYANPAYYPFGAGVSWSAEFRSIIGYDLFSAGSVAFSAEAGYVLASTMYRTADATLDGQEQYMSLGHFQSHRLEAAIRPQYVFGPSGRFNVYARAGAGAMFLTLHRSIESVPPELQGYYSTLSSIRPLPMVTGGAGLEYYTRLSHFSFTFAELNAYYVLGLDVAYSINFAGFKYTF